MLQTTTIGVRLALQRRWTVPRSRSAIAALALLSVGAILAVALTGPDAALAAVGSGTGGGGGGGGRANSLAELTDNGDTMARGVLLTLALLGVAVMAFAASMTRRITPAIGAILMGLLAIVLIVSPDTVTGTVNDVLNGDRRG